MPLLRCLAIVQSELEWRMKATNLKSSFLYVFLVLGRYVRIWTPIELSYLQDLYTFGIQVFLAGSNIKLSVCTKSQSHIPLPSSSRHQIMSSTVKDLTAGTAGGIAQVRKSA